MVKKTVNILICLLLIQLNIVMGQNSVILNVNKAQVKINKEIYGHFAEHLGNCIYGGIYVGESSSIPNVKGYRTDVSNALKEMHLPLLRWPGGCFADTYNWRNGIGPKKERPSMINVHWGGVTEDNSFGTHEFLDFCELIGCEPYVNLNVGSGTVREAYEWIEYVTSENESPLTELRKKNGREKPWNVKYWAAGNETWGCGGDMRPEYYADIYRNYASFMRGPEIYRIASGANVNDYNWTEVFMNNVKDRAWLVQGYSLHFYTVPFAWDKKGSATDFDEKIWMTTLNKTLFMNELIEKHSEIMDKYDPEKKIGLLVDEWGNWFDVEPGTNPGFLFQQNTLRDALGAATNLNIFNNHADRVKMSCIAQMVNVLQSVILTKENQMVLTPTYYVYKMYAVHQDATLVPIEIKSAIYTYEDMEIPAVNASASIKEGVLNITLCNMDPNNSQPVSFELNGMKASKIAGTIITASKINAYNDFGKPEQVNEQVFKDLKISKRELNCVLPAKSVVRITVNKEN